MRSYLCRWGCENPLSITVTGTSFSSLTERSFCLRMNLPKPRKIILNPLNFQSTIGSTKPESHVTLKSRALAANSVKACGEGQHHSIKQHAWNANCKPRSSVMERRQHPYTGSRSSPRFRLYESSPRPAHTSFKPLFSEEWLCVLSTCKSTSHRNN